MSNMSNVSISNTSGGGPGTGKKLDRKQMLALILQDRKRKRGESSGSSANGSRNASRGDSIDNESDEGGINNKGDVKLTNSKSIFVNDISNLPKLPLVRSLDHNITAPDYSAVLSTLSVKGKGKSTGKSKTKPSSSDIKKADDLIHDIFYAALPPAVIKSAVDDKSNGIWRELILEFWPKERLPSTVGTGGINVEQNLQKLVNFVSKKGRMKYLLSSSLSPNMGSDAGSTPRDHMSVAASSQGSSIGKGSLLKGKDQHLNMNQGGGGKSSQNQNTVTPPKAVEEAKEEFLSSKKEKNIKPGSQISESNADPTPKNVKLKDVMLDCIKSRGPRGPTVTGSVTPSGAVTTTTTTQPSYGSNLDLTTAFVFPHATLTSTANTNLVKTTTRGRGPSSGSGLHSSDAWDSDSSPANQIQGNFTKLEVPERRGKKKKSGEIESTEKTSRPVPDLPMESLDSVPPCLLPNYVDFVPTPTDMRMKKNEIQLVNSQLQALRGLPDLCVRTLCDNYGRLEITLARKKKQMEDLFEANRKKIQEGDLNLSNLDQKEKSGSGSNIKGAKASIKAQHITTLEELQEYMDSEEYKMQRTDEELKAEFERNKAERDEIKRE